MISRNLKIVTIFLILTSLVACAPSGSIKTNPKSIFVNNPKEVETCRYIGIVQSKHEGDWKWTLREKASEMGATHLYTTGPNGVTRDPEGETINANAYLCDQTKS